MNKIYVKFKDGSDVEHPLQGDAVSLGPGIMSFETTDSEVYVYNMDFLVGWKITLSKVVTPSKELSLV